MASPGVVCFVGLDELSLEMAALLVKSGYRIKAFQAAHCALMDQFLEVGGSKCDIIGEAGKDVTALIVTATGEVYDELIAAKQGMPKCQTMQRYSYRHKVNSTAQTCPGH
ncbi:unnamed protein product [Spirodela intermedia]|uniref:Uncharacterized protein n=1 Tax=Spirodela intermedia TaxID=51605 RepID=A0A7I8J403_SPIIN|nr:unnamed protein product [Spirodela intermedia]CAA6664820.1 unnamed protein product [Spirodela intermedia]